MKPRIKRLEFRPGARIIAISDIHGDLPYLRGLLDRINLTPADELVILGDIVEKGKDSLTTLRYIMALAGKYSVHTVCGNCDAWDPELDYPTPELDAFLKRYLNCGMGRRGLLVQMCAEIGFPVTEELDVPAMREALRERFVPELDFLRAMPHILETEDYTFIHGGLLPGGSDEWDSWRLMKNDNYMSHPIPNGKWQIVGHTPVVLYGGDITDANSRIDAANRIVGIDGGCVLKDDGQLNALIIPYAGSDDFFSVYYDRFPRRRVRSAQKASERSIYIRWGDSEVEVLEEGGEFSRCRHVRTRYELDILTANLRREDGRVTTNDCTDYALPLSPGDEISVVAETSRGYQCKRNGISGWYYGELE